MQHKLLGQGAEATVYREGAIVLKVRSPKRYRHPLLDDELRNTRFRREVKVIDALVSKGVAVPKVLGIDEKKAILKQEYIEGIVLKEVIVTDPAKYGVLTGQLVAGVHAAGIVHGDLTTSNIIVTKNALYLLDFGLSFFSTTAEDRGVDLHVFEQIIHATHAECAPEIWHSFEKGYQESFPDAHTILMRLEHIRRRGRNKPKI